MKEAVEDWLGGHRFRLLVRVRDPRSAALLRDFVITLGDDLPYLNSLEQEHLKPFGAAAVEDLREAGRFMFKRHVQEWALVSPDGTLLAIRAGNRITLWDVPPRRPHSCWLTCSAISLLAAWLAWPRKVKAPAVA
jgi:hypothetical protein